MHIAALAVALKVPVGKLEALEADNYAVLPDTVFVRALASSVCRTLKVDPGPILSLLPQSQGPRLSTDGAGLNAPVKTSLGKSSSSSNSFSPGSTSRPVTFVVLALLVGAVAVFFFPRQESGSVISSVPEASPSVGAGDGGAAAPASPASAVEMAAAKSEVPPGDKGGIAAPMKPVAPAPDAVASQALAPAAAASEGASATVAPSGALVLRARSQSWVQVRDASGAVVLQRNLAAEESVSVNAPTPLAVVVGRADATEVFVRGKPFDLAGVSRENVARFEVK